MRKQKGFTLIEIILIIALFALIIGLTAPYIWTYMARQQLAVAAEDVVSNLRRAQNKAIINQENTKWGVYFYHDYYAIIQYPSETVSENFLLPDNLYVSDNNIIFHKLTGKLDDDAAITVTHSGINEQKIIILNEEGNIQIQ